MPFPTIQQNNNIYKQEGTSQTYGQLVIFPSKQDSVPLDPKIVTNSPRDIVVKLIPNGPGSLNAARISDIQRSKISLAAFSDNKEAIIDLSADTGAAVVETGKQEFVRISTVYQNIEDFAIVVGGEKTPTELASVTKEASKTDFFITLKSQESEIIEYNNLKDVELKSEFIYNFYIPEETDIISQENQNQDPLLKNDIFNVPRYVKLTWEPKHVTENISNIENDFLRTISTSKRIMPKGVVGANSFNFKNSLVNSSKVLKSFSAEGVDYNLVDTHKLDLAFSNTNNQKIFTNTLNMTIESQGGSSTLPIATPVPPASPRSSPSTALKFPAPPVLPPVQPLNAQGPLRLYSSGAFVTFGRISNNSIRSNFCHHHTK